MSSQNLSLSKLETSTFLFEGSRAAYPAWRSKMQSLLAIKGLDCFANPDSLSDEHRRKAYFTLLLSLPDSVQRSLPGVAQGDAKGLVEALDLVYAPKDPHSLALLYDELRALRFTNLPEFLDRIWSVSARLQAAGVPDKKIASDVLAHEVRILSRVPEYAVLALPILRDDPSKYTVDARTEFELSLRNINARLAPLESPSTAMSLSTSGCVFCTGTSHKQEECRRYLAARKKAQEEVKRNRAKGRRGPKPESAPPQVASAETVPPPLPSQPVAFSAVTTTEVAAVSSSDATAHEICADSGATDHICNDLRMFTSTYAVHKTVTVADGGPRPVQLAGTVEGVTKEGQHIRLTNTLYLPTAPRSLLSVPRLVSAGHSVELRPAGTTLSFHTAAGASSVATQRLANGLEVIYLQPVKRTYAQALVGSAQPAPMVGSPQPTPTPMAPATTELSQLSGMTEVPSLSLPPVTVLRPKSPASATSRMCCPGRDAFVAGTVSPSNPEVTDPITVHQRLGHLNAADMVKLGALKKTGDLPFCEHCAKAKSKRAPASRKAVKRSTSPGQLTHVDLNGPMETASLSGKRYALAFVDDHSRHVVIYLLSSKDEVPSYFRQYHQDMQRFGVNIGAVAGDQDTSTVFLLHGDNDSVFRSATFQAVLAELNVVFRACAPHTPSQNGIAERMWLSLVDSARAMLLAAGLPKSYWGAAMRHAALLRNLSPSTGAKGQVPLQLLTGSTIPVSRLRIFGCRAYVHDSRTGRKKWDPKARTGVYLGHCLLNNAHYVRLLDTGAIVETIHVVFDESAVHESSAPPLSSTPVVSHPLLQCTEDDDVPPLVPDSDDGDSDQLDQSLTSCSTSSGSESPPPSPPPSPMPAVPSVPASPETDCLLSDSDEEVSEVLSVTGDPSNVRTALSSPEADSWLQAMMDEWTSIELNNTWVAVPLSSVPAGLKPLHTKWVFRTKRASDGSVARYKCRLVVRGDQQRAGVDYNELFAPVASVQAIRLLLAIAATSEVTVHQMDFTTAFLNADIEEEVYLWAPPSAGSWSSPVPQHHVLRLKRTLYGLRQSPRAWNKLLNDLLASLGFTRSQVDPCLYQRRSGSHLTLLVVYVDDLLVWSTCAKYRDEFKSALSARYRTTDLGVASWCLGMRITQQAGSIAIDQGRYAASMLAKFSMTDCRAVGTPLPPGTVLRRYDTTVPATGQLLGSKDATLYRSHRLC